MSQRIYSTPEWANAREAALARDGHRCAVARLLGGECAARLDVHHIVPVAQGGSPYDVDNLLTACQRHHPMVESLRRQVLRKRGVKRCSHHHPYPQGRVECERRLAMQG